MLPRASQSTDVNSWLTRVSCMCPQSIPQMIHTFTYFKLFLRDAKTSPKQTVKGGSCSRPLTSCDPTSHKQSVSKCYSINRLAADASSGPGCCQGNTSVQSKLTEWEQQSSRQQTIAMESCMYTSSLSPRLQTHIPATTLLRVCIPRLVSVWISTCINYKLKFKRIKSDRIMDCRHAKRLVAGRLLMCHSCMCGLMQPDAVSEKDVHQLVYIIRTEVRS